MEQRCTYKRSTIAESIQAWQRLLWQCRKVPWEIRPADIQAHVAWMQKQGYAPGTINKALWILSSFYRWCDRLRVDPDCGPGFNPAAAVSKLKIKHYYRVKLLSRGEVRALLRILKRDTSPLINRSFVFNTRFTMPKVTGEYFDTRRQQIIEAAYRCFARKGFHQTTIKFGMLKAED
jgi:integrase